MPTEDKRVGKLLPSPVTPPDTVCFTIQVPNAVQYRAAFLGQIGVLAQALTWDHPTDGTQCADCEEAAQLWSKAIYEAAWSDDCEIDMSCANVADCIDTDIFVRNSINNMITNISTPGVLSVAGQAMTPTQTAMPLNPMDECDLDILWAQTEQFVLYATNAGTDLLNKIETYSNSLEAATFIELAPILGSIIDEVQLDKALQLFDWVAETAGEFYLAANNEIAREQLACDLFCPAKPDCVISIDLVWNVLNERLGGVLNPGDITNFVEFADALLTIVGNEDIALDLWLVSLTGFAKFLGYFGVRGLDETLRLVLLLAADEPSNNWETLCVDCGTPVEEYVPEIGTWLDQPGGTLTGPDVDGYYVGTATNPGSDWRVSIQEATGKTFRLVNITYPGGMSACQVFERADTSVYIGCGFINQYGNEGNPAINTIIWTWSAQLSVRFQMVAP